MKPIEALTSSPVALSCLTYSDVQRAAEYNTQQQFCELALAANVEQIVMTHFNPHISMPELVKHCRSEIVFAAKLDRF